MYNYKQVTQDYPQAVITGVSEYYLPKQKWKPVTRPVDAVLQFQTFEAQIADILRQGATRIAFTILQQKTHYTVFVTARQLAEKCPKRRESL